MPCIIIIIIIIIICIVCKFLHTIPGSTYSDSVAVNLYEAIGY